MAIPTKTRWKKEESKFEYITENPLKLSDLELDKCLKRKLLVQLKLLPTNVNRKRAKKFVVSLIKAIDYKGGLLIELDDHVANLIGSEVLMLKQKVTMVIKASQFEDLKEEYKQSESVYSNFKYFVVVDDNSELKMELTENEKLYRCELNIYGSKRRTKQRSPTHDQVDSIKNEKSISVYDDDDDCNDVDDDDDDNDEDDDEDDDDEEDADREYIDYVELVFGERKGYMSAGNILTLKDACKVDMLRKHIYEGVVQHYGLQHKINDARSQPNGVEPIEIDIDAFYVGLALNYVDTKWNENYIFSWDEDSLENVLRMLVTEFKTNFLEKLLDLYKPHSFITQKLEKITDTICPEQQYHEKYPDFLPNDKLGCFIRLFIHALEKRQFKASLFYWTKQERLIWTSLFARHVLKEEKRKQKIDMLENVKAKFQKYKRIYECTAINILKSCYRRNRNRTLFLLMNVDSKCKQSCITIALKTKNKLFLAQEACIRANNEIWQTYLGEDLSTEQRKEDNQTESKANTKKLDKPLQEEKKSENKMLPREVRPDMQTKRDSRSEQKKELDKLLHKEENSEIELADFHADSNTNVNNKLPDTTPTTVTKKKINIKHYLFSPQGRCRMDMISYLWFLTAYSILLVSTLHQTTFHWLEGVVMGYKVIFFAKESDQCFPQCFKSWKTFRHYICDPFNILDHLSILISIMAWSLRLVAFVNPEEERLMVAARYLLCLVFMLYMVRFLEFFYQDEFFGPILVVIRNMVKTYIYFLLILANILVTYSVVSESILFPEKELKADILYSVFRRGFWAMLGEYFLDEIELFSDDTSNNSDTANSSMRGVRPTEDGKYSIPILLAVYVLFVQILMFNLLIALFNNAISENETKGRMIWSHQKFLLTMQYSKTKILLPPFIILSFCLKEKFGNPFKTKKGDKVNILKKFEREAAKMIINQIIKQRYVNKFSHDDTKVASVAQVKNMEKKLMKLSGSLRQLMPKYDFLRAKEVQDKRRTDVPEKDVELKKMIERLEKMSFKKKGHGDSDDTPRNDQEINVSAEVTDCQQGSSKLIEDKLSNVDGN